MALTVGTDSYVTLANAETYISNYSSGTVTEAQLRQATKAIDRLYGFRFIGSKTDSAQALSFPRNGDTSIPSCVAEATIELALKIAAGFNQYAQPDGAVTEETVEVDVIKTTKKYGSATSTNEFFLIETILAPVLINGAGYSFAEVLVG